jgi:hypothetical protein
MSFKTETVSIADGPTIEFLYNEDIVRAELSGAKLYGELCGPDTVALRLTDANGEILADIIVKPRSHRTVTENVMDVGSALLWSHWRYLQAKSKPFDREDLKMINGIVDGLKAVTPTPIPLNDMDDCREED